MPGITAVQPTVKSSPLKPQKSKRSRKTPQPDLVARRTPRRTTPSAQAITQRSSRRKNGTVLNKRKGKPSSFDPLNGGTQDSAVITLPTNLEEPRAKEGEFIPAVAHDTSHTMGLLHVPEGKDSVPKLNEVAKLPKPVTPQGNKRKKRASTGKHSKKKPKVATSRETTGHATPPDIGGLNLVNTGLDNTAIEQASQTTAAPHTPEKQTGLPNLSDILSPTNTAQSPGEIRRRLIAIAQSSLKRLWLELPDEAREPEETLIQPSIEAPAPINYGPELSVADQANNSNESPSFVQPKSSLLDPTGNFSLIPTAKHEREKITLIDQHLSKRPKLTHVIEDPETVSRLSTEDQESALIQLAPAAEPQGGEVTEEFKSKSPAGQEMLHRDEPLQVPPRADLERQDPLQEDPLQEDPLQEGSLREGPLQEDPLQDDPLQEDPLHDDPHHEDLARQGPLQEDPLQDNPPPGKLPKDDSPSGDPPHEPSVENDDQNSGPALSKTVPKNKLKRKKRKAIGQQSLRKKAKPVLKPAIRPPALNPVAKPQVAHINETSNIKFRGKPGSRKVAQILDYNDDDGDEDLLSISNYEPVTRLARGLGGKTRAATVEGESIVGRNVGKPGVVNKLVAGRRDMSSKVSDNGPLNGIGLGRAKKVAIRTSQKLQLHSPSRLSSTSTTAKQNSTVKNPRGISSLKNAPSSLDDDYFWYPQPSDSDEPIKPLTRRRGPRLRSTLVDEPVLEDEDELKLVDKRTSTKPDSFDTEDETAEGEPVGIDPIAPAREDFSDQDEYDELRNDGDAGSISKTAINKASQRLQSEAANPSKTTIVPKPRPRTRNPPKNSIPITVYRMPSNHDLDPDTDDSNHTNNTINAVDVLAQACREQISKSATSVSEAANQESNRSKKLALERKAKTIKMYGDELDLQLFHLVSPIHPSTFSPPFPSRISPFIITQTNSIQSPTDPSPKH